MIWFLLIVALGAISYFAFKSQQTPSVTLKAMTEKAKAEVKEAPVPVVVAPVEPKPEVKKVRKKYGGKVKKAK